MQRPDFLEQIKSRLENAKKGDVFVPSDFFDIAEPVKINMCLSRLAEKGQLQRVMHGVYAKPRFSELLGEYVPPNSTSIAQAIARNYGWTIIPCGDTALNMLGLTTQVPAVWLYVSDGPYKAYEADGIVLKFKHTNNREITNLSYKTALVIQALKALGRSNITEKEINKLDKLLTQEEKRIMLDEGRRSTAWVYEIIKKICGEA